MLDFKETEYRLGNDEKKYELLKDISAFVNHPSNEDKYIIVGVRTKNGRADVYLGLSDITDDAKYQQLVDSNLVPKINFEYREFLFGDKRLAYFRIYNNENRPYLFSKDLRNPVVPNKIDYRAGDGYIRQGTSSRRLTREDFEAIYKGRYSTRDRKGDIKITPLLRRSTEDELYGYRYFDFEIENVSTKSINLDASIKIFNTDGIRVRSSTDVILEIRESKHDAFFSIYSAKINPLPSLDVDVECLSGYTQATRLRVRGGTSAISIAQHDKDPCVFCQTLIVIAEHSGTIRGEITIRSDDFTTGSLVKQFSVEYQHK